MYCKSPQISNAATIKLIEEYQRTHDIEARNKIILGNLRLVFAIAHKNRRKLESSFEDFVSDGVIGMIEAINSFDTKIYKRFSTYAWWHILKKVNTNLQMGSVTIPPHRVTIYNAYVKAKAEMLKRGEVPDIATIAKTIKVSIKVLTDTISRSSEISANEYSSSSDNIQRFGEEPLHFENDIATKIDFAKAKHLMASDLSKQEQDILRYRFGLDGSEPLTLQQTAAIMKISAEYVRLLQNKSLLRLKKLLTKKCLR